MSLVKKPTTTAPAENKEKTKYKDGDVIFRRVISADNPNFLGYATVFYHGIVLNDIAVTIVDKNGEPAAGLIFPGKPRMVKNDKGEYVQAVGENGYKIYNNYFNPTTKEAREELVRLVEEKVNEVLAEEEAQS